ncbi:hypothetical protein Q8791_02665 [Nocardiopsis sp. CT-R113]|uniref:Uncharacterized protein n=1 Tax=Nocardiopsis codii TaxID=3065942 RepID=A0ABU7K1J7_9ACTN|nr:hypothetical protein [Nocardiopsis sp. CT-R113]MEE2036123.1 hypothetical protein [Nocardiopsis sp. CT-R113]
MSPNENPLELTALVARVIHGIKHMPAGHLVLRAAVLAVFTATTVWVSTGPDLFGSLAGTLLTASTAAVISLELYTAALMCEQDADPQGDTDEFGTAA